MEELEELKLGTVSNDSIFHRTVQEHFTEYYRPLIPHVDRLRKKVFPGGGIWKNPNQKLYGEMKVILQVAQHELKELEGPRNSVTTPGRGSI